MACRRSAAATMTCVRNHTPNTPYTSPTVSRNVVERLLVMTDHSRFLNGTVYETLQLTGSDTLAKCCEKCTKDRTCNGVSSSFAMQNSPCLIKFLMIQNGVTSLSNILFAERASLSVDSLAVGLHCAFYHFEFKMHRFQYIIHHFEYKMLHFTACEWGGFSERQILLF